MKTSLVAVMILGLMAALAVPALAAGNVWAELSKKGDLKITGTDDSNQIMVTNDGFGNVRVVGMPSTGTTVRGAAEWVFLETNFDTVDGKLHIDLKDGNNYVEIDDINVGGDLKIKMRDGDDTIGIFGTDLSDSISMKLGDGSNLAAIVDGTIADKLNVKSTSGSDSIAIASCVQVGGKTKIKTGSGGDRVLLEGTYLDKLKLDAGKGSDQFFFNLLSSPGNVSIKLGSENDGIVVASSAVFSGVVKLNGASGEDDVQIVHPATLFDAKTKGIERFLVDPAADAMPGAISSEMSVAYIGRGGDPADISCP